MTVRSPVEKLILYRKKYKISQKELAGDSMSRSHLAMIETGKNSLNEKTAKSLIHNFNKILESNNISDRIIYEDLMETKEMQVTKLKDKFLEKLNQKFDLDETIKEIESYVSEYDIETKISLYKKIGDLFMEAENLSRAASFYLRIINDLIIIQSSEKLGEISLCLLRIYIKTENFLAAVDLENLIKSEIIKFKKEEMVVILYNFGFVYDNLNENYKALEYFSEVEKYVSNKEKIFDIKNLQGLSFTDLKNFSEANSIYRSLMLKYNSPIQKLIINNNLLYLSKVKKDINKIKFYYRKCKLLLENNHFQKDDFIAIEQINNHLGETALFLNRKKDAKLFFFSVCKNKSKRNFKLKLKAIQNLLFLLNKKELEEISYLENLYFELLDFENDFTCGYKFLEFYQKEILTKEASLFLNRINKKINNII